MHIRAVYRGNKKLGRITAASTKSGSDRTGSDRIVHFGLPDVEWFLLFLFHFVAFCFVLFCFVLSLFSL